MRVLPSHLSMKVERRVRFIFYVHSIFLRLTVCSGSPTLSALSAGMVGKWAAQASFFYACDFCRHIRGFWPFRSSGKAKNSGHV